MYFIFVFQIFLNTVSTDPTFVINPNTQDINLCSDNRDELDEDAFRVRSCANCFHHLFRQRYANEFQVGTYGLQLKYLYLTKDGATSRYSPDILNDSSLLPVCDLLTANDCGNWKLCCARALDCCKRQRSIPHKDDGQHCKRTWDGYTCWDDTLAGSQVHKPCPDFMYTIDKPAGTRYSTKTCHENGTWFSKNGGYSHWTDYTMCPKVEGQWTVLYISMATNIASMSLLIPAIIIFLTYRSLRRQHRVKVHTNFFFSLLLCALSQVLWDFILTQDALKSSIEGMKDSRLEDNSIGCRILSVVKVYFASTNYFWMFCEGYYLHRLLSDAFRPPANLIPLYMMGWVLPAIPVVIYSIIRMLYSNRYCWVYSYGEYSWIYYVPNMLCLIINLLFLCNILRVITSRLQSHPNEPSNFRKGLKAVFVLIPLFGLQLFVTIYRPPQRSQGLSEYDAFHSFITNSQGFFVALIFCFFNKEVMNHMRYVCSGCCFFSKRNNMRHYATSYATSLTTDAAGSSFKVSLRKTRQKSYLYQANLASPSVKGGRVEEKLEQAAWNNMNGVELLVTHNDGNENMTITVGKDNTAV